MGGSLAPGVVVGGDFRILEPLQAGGMGAVYVAEQLSTGKRRALKVMHAALVEDPVQVERFVRESRLAARVQSDHVIEILAAGVQEEDGTPWLAMELLEGCDLSRLVKGRGPLDLDEVLAITEQLCHGLAAAHDEGIVHRDLKPSNVFFARRRSSAQPWSVKILDFGIAKAVVDATSSKTAALGSPAWMAPEQTEASAAIAPASDVWPLGLVVFWMVTGRVYWTAANSGSPRMQAIFREMLFEPLARGSVRARAIGAPAPFPEALDDWLARCLAREPADRFPEARAAWRALRGAGAGEAPVSQALPATVATRVAEVVAATTRREPTGPPTEADGPPPTAATREVSPPSEARASEAPATAATRDVTPADEAPETRARPPNEEGPPPTSATREVAPPETEAPARAAPGDRQARAAEAEEAEGVDPGQGPTLESHELDARRGRAEAERDREARRRWVYAAALLLGGGLAVGAFATRDAQSPAAPPPGAMTTSSVTDPSAAAPPGSSRASTALPSPHASLAEAQRALEAGRLGDAEREASKVLADLGSSTGRRPVDRAPSLSGARAQRVLVGVALARAVQAAPLDGGGRTGLAEVLAAREPFLAEATSACAKATGWSDDARASCCHADLAHHLLDLIEAAPELSAADEAWRALRARVTRKVEALRGEPGDCVDLAVEAARRLDALAPRPPSQPSATPTAPSSPGGRRPFDPREAAQQLGLAKAQARRTCSPLFGDRVVTVTLTYHASGSPNVSALRSSPAARCVANQMINARLSPFAPGTEPPPRTVTITLD